jgi:hypothetical protein
MFLFQSVQKGAQGASAQQLIPPGNFTPQMKQWLGAAEPAAKEFREMIAERTKTLRANKVYLGPNVADPSFFYRLRPGQTAQNLPEYVGEESFALTHNLPFVKRDVDYMKNPANFAGAPEEVRAQRKVFLDAFESPQFSRSIVSEQEFGLLGRLIYEGRQEGAKNRGILFSSTSCKIPQQSRQW